MSVFHTSEGMLSTKLPAYFGVSNRSSFVFCNVESMRLGMMVVRANRQICDFIDEVVRDRLPVTYVVRMFFPSHTEPLLTSRSKLLVSAPVMHGSAAPSASHAALHCAHEPVERCDG